MSTLALNPAGFGAPAAPTQAGAIAVTPDAIFTGGPPTDGPPAEEEVRDLSPCPICGSHPYEGPEGAYQDDGPRRGQGWHHTWHCWRCGYRKGQTENTITLLSQQAQTDATLLAKVRDELMGILLTKLAQAQPASAALPASGVSSEEMAALRAEVAALREAQAGAVPVGPPPAPDAPSEELAALRSQVAQLLAERQGQAAPLPGTDPNTGPVPPPFPGQG